MPDLEPRLIPLGQIPWTDCFDYQCREKMDSAHIAKLRELVEESDEEQQKDEKELRLDLFPPLEVFTQGGMSDPYYLADGFHRYEALMQAGREAYLCRIHVANDPRGAAADFALSANTTHGLPRTPEDCERAYFLCRKWHPNLPLYGKVSVQSMTGLSKATIYKYSLRERDNGRDVPLRAYTRSKIQERRKSGFSDPDGKRPVGHESSCEQLAHPSEDRCNPNHEPAPELVVEPVLETLYEKPARAAKTLDGLKRQIPPGLLKKDNRATVAVLLRELGMIVSKVDALCGTDGWEYLDAAGVGRTIKTAQNGIKAAEFYTECPRCDMDKACKLCKGCGFITSLQHARLDDREKAILNQ